MDREDRERWAQVAWQLQKRHQRLTGRDVPLYYCERCEDMGFLYAHRDGVTAATPCTCRLRKMFADCDDEKRVRQLDELLQRTERQYLTGELMPPSKVAELELEEWLARTEGGER